MLDSNCVCCHWRLRLLFQPFHSFNDSRFVLGSQRVEALDIKIVASERDASTETFSHFADAPVEQTQGRIQFAFGRQRRWRRRGQSPKVVHSERIHGAGILAERLGPENVFVLVASVDGRAARLQRWRRRRHCQTPTNYRNNRTDIQTTFLYIIVSGK